MKKVANAPSTPATTMSIAKMPRFIATAIGESLSPKQTGHASAMRGAASIPSVSKILRISITRASRSAEAVALQLSRFPLKRRTVEPEADAGGERRQCRHRVGEVAGRTVLLPRPGGDKRREDHGHGDEEQVKRLQRHHLQ